MRLSIALAGLAALLLPGCGIFPGGGERTQSDRLDAEISVVEVPGQGETVYIRSTRPRFLGQIFQRTPGDVSDQRRAELEAAVAGAPATADGAAATAAGLVPDCHLPAEKLARATQVSPAGFALYDPDPQGTKPRTLHVTGFADGCPRALVAAVAVLGTASAHEASRYNPLNEAPWSAADLAYERARAEFCEAPAGEPCPAAAREALDRRLALLSFYRSLGADASWEVLVLQAEGDESMIADAAARRR